MTLGRPPTGASTSRRHRSPVLAGFAKGMSIMDRNLILDGGGNAAPPFVFQANSPTWSLNSVGKVFDTQ